MDLVQQRIVIIGAGQAAAQLCQSLRQYGHKGQITLIGDEPVLPYQRPPLSKAYMKGEMAEERLYFKPPAWYEDQHITVRLGMRAVAVDRAAGRIMLEDGGHADYDRLVIATGARPRKLSVPGAELAHVHDLRTLADVERIKPGMISGRRMVIVGAGYIGLEAAAVARQMGLEVTVVEMAPRVLARVTGPDVSAFYTRVHEEEGVQILTDARLAGLEGEDGEVRAAVLADGTRLPADNVLVGIGIVPNEELAQEADLPCDNGIVVDRDARTADPAIFACGDCTFRPLHYYDRNGRLESVHNAIEQAKLAAAAIMDRDRPSEDCPWFWSDQYDLKLQIAGLSAGYDQTVLRGDPAARKFALFYLRKGKLLAVDAVNSPPEFLVSKKLIMAGAEVSADQLADETVSMKEIAAEL